MEKIIAEHGDEIRHIINTSKSLRVASARIQKQFEIGYIKTLQIINHMKFTQLLQLPVSPKAYLRRLVMQGGEERYGKTFVNSPVFINRVETELDSFCAAEDTVIYLLIIADLVHAAHQMGIMVGPGRSSEAGSLVLYCLKITNIDPLQYDLLFERFYSNTYLLPEIAIDVEEGERDKLINYLVHKYGEAHVAHILIRGKMHGSGIAISINELEAKPVDYESLESKRIMKLDILELQCLTTIKNCLHSIKQAHGIELDINSISEDDELTFKIFQEGQTSDIFQFQSNGMQRYLRELVPNSFEELVALNAMYRPGPMEKIPQYIARKHGKELIQYDIPIMEKFLNETYEIIVYQEQLMMLCQKMAHFTPAESDIVRKAFSRNRVSVIETELRNKFMSGGIENGYNEADLTKVWYRITRDPWNNFLKSHSICYTWLAYQMAYLKAHYYDEFVSAHRSVWDNDNYFEKHIKEEQDGSVSN